MIKPIIILFSLTGCALVPASATHVEKSEEFTVALFDHVLKTDPIAQPTLQDFKAHVEEGASVKVPDAIKKGGLGLLDTAFPGAAGLISIAVGMYAKKKRDESIYVTEKSVEAAKQTDPNKALEMLKQDPRVRYTG